LFRKAGFTAADVPETDRFFDNMVSFPFSIEISDADFAYMIDAVRTSLQRLRS
jgi:dTDP-4-amino-4,6-dideoxygalactose transaminase